MLKRIDERLHRLASSYSDDEHGKIRRAIYQYRWRYPENRHLWDQRLDNLRRISDDVKQTLTYQREETEREYTRLSRHITDLSTQHSRDQNVENDLQTLIQSIIKFMRGSDAARGENLLIRAIELMSRAKDPERLSWREVESAFQCRLVGGMIVNTPHHEPDRFFRLALPVLVERVGEALQQGPVKINAGLQSRFVHPTKMTEHHICLRVGTFELFPGYDYEDVLQARLIDAIRTQLDTFEEGDSGLVLDDILYLKVNINKYSAIPCGTYVDMPEWVVKTRTVLNIRNTDQKCFLWSVLAALHPCKKNAGRVSKYRRHEFELEWTEKDFPMSLKGIKKFEEVNDLRIYVFAWDEDDDVLHPWFVSRRETGRCIDLFVLPGSEKSYHFALIRDIHRFLHSQTGYARGRGELCRNCLSYVPDRMLDVHQFRCFSNNPCRVVVPASPRLEFKNRRYREPVPVVCYADFECTLVQDGSRVCHRPAAVGLYVHVQPFVISVQSGYQSYCGEDCVKWFLDRVMEVADALAEEYRKNTPMTFVELEKSQACWICQRRFNSDDLPVADHNHWTGEFRGWAHQDCNINYREPRIVPVILHNLSGYDGHFIVDGLTRHQYEQLDVLPTSKEKCISCSVLRDNVRVRFIDSYRFMARSLEALGQNLDVEDKRILRAQFEPEEFPYANEKLHFPYE